MAEEERKKGKSKFGMMVGNMGRSAKKGMKRPICRAKEILTCGFVREYCEFRDIIKLIAEWTSDPGHDCIDVSVSDDNIDVQRVTNRDTIEYQTVKRKKEKDFQRYKTAVGSCIIRKGMRQCWNFCIHEKSKRAATILIGVIDNEKK
eukprot:380066_1